VTLALPLPAYAQQPERIRRIGMLTEFSEVQMQPLVGAFRQQLQRLGWKEGSFTIDLRFAIADAAQFAAAAAALVATSPDIVIALGSRALKALKDETRSIPVWCSRWWPIRWRRA
jgi:ABC-type uncharacterized transport system substrate-binding protein